MSIELKGLNYYSKVFKRINYRLSNNTFWVVISEGRLFDWDNGFCTLTMLAEGDSEVSLKEAMEALIPRWERRWKQRETERDERKNVNIIYLCCLLQ